MKLQRKKKTETTNKKIRNATPTEYDGIKFRSKLEVTTYKLFKEAGIDANYEKEKFTLVPAFSFMGAKIRPMTYTPDFTFQSFIIECKGSPNDAWPIKEKLFKYYLHTNKIDKTFHVVHNQKEIKELIEIIKPTKIEA